jgi:hypothetical protein
MFDTDDIVASYSTLMRQAPMTVMEYVRDLKSEMGEEWVKGQPASLRHAGTGCRHRHAREHNWQRNRQAHGSGRWSRLAVR